MTVPRRRKPLQGDEDTLFETLAEDLVHVVRRLVHTDHATIDDTCQFAWLQLLRCQPKRETVRAWLVTVARNEAIRLDRIRRRCEALSVGEREPGCHPEPAAATDAYTLAIDLDEALTVLASLPERKRDLYALKVLGFSYEEIGRITGDSYSAVIWSWLRHRRLTASRRRRRHVADRGVACSRHAAQRRPQSFIPVGP